MGRGIIGCDRSANLIEICGQKGMNALVCDGLLLPYRDRCFDAAISIAVFHHISTKERRLHALQELTRIIKIGGHILIYAWAQEQDDDETNQKLAAQGMENDSRRRFQDHTSQDVLVPWHLKKSKKKMENKKKNKKINGDANDKDKGDDGGDGDDGDDDGGEKKPKRARVEKTKLITKKDKKSDVNSNSPSEIEEEQHQVYQRYCHVYRRGDLEHLVNQVDDLEVIRTYFDCSNWAVVCRKIATDGSMYQLKKK